MADLEINAARGILKVSGALTGEDDVSLRRACDELLRGPSRRLLVDMTGVDSIVSICVGVIAAMWLDAITMERELEVAPSKEVRRIFQIAGFDRVFNLRDG